MFWGISRQLGARLPLDRKIREFQMLTLVNIYYNDSIPSAYMSVILTGLSVAFILTTFCTMRLYQYVELIVYAYFPFISVCAFGLFSGILLTGSMLYSQSIISCRQLKAASMSVRKNQRRRHFKRQLKTIHPYGVKIWPLKHPRKINLMYVYDYYLNLMIFLLTFW